MTEIYKRSKRTGSMRPAFPPTSRTFQTSATKSSPDLFVSAKTIAAIPTRHPARLDALIQASLDPQVRSIEYIASVANASAQMELDAIVVQRDDGRFLLDIVPARRLSDAKGESLAQIALTELHVRPCVLASEEIRREPRYSNARLVWSYRGAPVSAELRMRILQALLDEGPLPLGELLKSIRSEHDPLPAVLALACADLLSLELMSQPLGPATLARYRA
ncbi:hypothetical protein Nham_1980 [Nitrobacter hamburgensis X14]|uniref:TnsA endonuclease N-terminal domain-containing protein n=1 Tax=Nitrobacter hamburgensis (strain DSM 10229 / NCIMB 13809 / X14) TaxID=323097 RepID=Q1QLW7_NITHX|nr:hypothetical protein [Nitrobacter hamburgensis]ABE62780.1 hypothetical protein Nham_1980 [Nitrobacter hamburgensis X14]